MNKTATDEEMIDYILGLDEELFQDLQKRYPLPEKLYKQVVELRRINKIKYPKRKLEL